ncbi:flavin-dependent oxidoreductase [Streptomyces sp. WAC05374]|uniref:FAD-dependent monooxygenase n=1 Tax=Streptomyces sp. WAC05374 TaxID=2487420 RepID=UPI000F881437|nr:FAD-dependent monooxygenase [Streptomyces sp. WAC05374]RST18739.1 flavin-dependent oxidoreductase [Streptomyces sp. WAC05374]TDF40279.1 flavin-dependent oxidoreductase [Streptomyces sp. WAC05374]TDF53469.1 flavin-dependent oxidoreductase [Streptomyces sp. WAC05374]TDF59316.1 flavin-dependent oxidoreductase [Streptomyces sp. WAC05374]
MTPHILVAGGGIAGLTAALALHAAGFGHVTVVEAAPGIRPVGAGLNIMPNAVRELDALGLLDELEANAVRTRELRYYHRSGGLISCEPRGLGAGHHWPQLSVHRAHLQRVLADAVRRRLGPSAIVTGVRVTGLEQLPDGRPRVRLEHREGARAGRASLEPDVLIGADGIRSAVRAALNPREGEPPWNGMLVWRGVSRLDARRAGRFMLIAGDDRCRAVVYPMAERPSGEVLVNWALAMPADSIAGTPRGGTLRSTSPGSFRGSFRGDWNRAVPVSDFLHHYEGWEFGGVNLPEVLRAADTAHEYPMVDREPLLRWSHGRTTLIGDAAHAMYPIGSNGATQSVIDARALAHAMAHHPDPARALAAYEAGRRPAMTELQRANRRQGPEVVINLAHRRAPGGFDRIDDVIPPHERREIAARYAATGAFDPETVNAGSPYEVPVSAP